MVPNITLLLPDGLSVQTLKTTALVDTETQAIMDDHYTTEKRHDKQLG
jgi:IS5 family transposase